MPYSIFVTQTSPHRNREKQKQKKKLKVFLLYIKGCKIQLLSLKKKKKEIVKYS